MKDKYEVISHTFLGTKDYNGEVYGYTYKITFNQSLLHTGRINGIEDGLNAYVKKENRQDVTDSFKQLWYAILRLVKR